MSHDDYVKRDELGQLREDWRVELQTKLGSFKHEVRLLLIGTLVILKFHLPSSITVGAVALVAAKSAWGFFSRH